MRYSWFISLPRNFQFLSQAPYLYTRLYPVSIVQANSDDSILSFILFYFPSSLLELPLPNPGSILATSTQSMIFSTLSQVLFYFNFDPIIFLIPTPLLNKGFRIPSQLPTNLPSTSSLESRFHPYTNLCIFLFLLSVQYGLERHF